MNLEINKITRGLSMAGMLSLLILISCQDSLEERVYKGRDIRFSVSQGDEWHASRADGAEVFETLPRDTVQLLQGCDDKSPLYLHTFYTDSFATSLIDAPLSRAVPITSSNMYSSFGVSAYSYPDTWDETKLPNHFYNIPATKSGGYFELATASSWPGPSQKIKFFAYAPIDNSNYVLSSSTVAGSPTIAVTVPSDVAQQQDLIVAATGEMAGDFNNSVDFTFKHVLTAVRFVCGNDMSDGTIKAVRLKNVLPSCVYKFSSSSWETASGTPTTFEQTGLNLSTVGNSNGTPIITDAKTFMMIPQTLPAGASIEIEFTDADNKPHTFTAAIGGTEWPMGKTVTYQISTTSLNWRYELEAPGQMNFTYEGGSQNYNLLSYKYSVKNPSDKQPVPWTVEFSEDGKTWTTTKPAWLTTFSVSGAGSTVAQTYSATITAQSGTDSWNASVHLKSRAVVRSASNPWNLADAQYGNDDLNTANCYVVTAPGYYSFPAVYGNALKDAMANTSAYNTGQASSANFLGTFVNHLGNSITNPYISLNSGCTPTKAQQLWLDSEKLIQNIQYNSGRNGYITFYVSPDWIAEGNAWIMLLDEAGTILWSWHIWVTDKNIDQTIAVKNSRNVIYNFMPVNLGWCDNVTKTYPMRSCKVKFIAGGLSKEMTITQAAAQITSGGNNPYYQWGRKDPLGPSLHEEENKTLWDKNGYLYNVNPKWTYFGTGITSLKNCILTPDRGHGSAGADKTYLNLWDANNTTVSGDDDNAVIKTIYDPCPVGYRVPVTGAFSGFSSASGSWGDVGMSFYTDDTKSNTIYFHAEGYRLQGCFRQEVHVSGVYWSARPYNTSNGTCLYFKNGQVLPLSSRDRYWAASIRPVKE